MVLYIVATFKHSRKIEIALADLESNGLDKSNILVLPLDNRVESPQLFDTKNQTDRESMIDIAAILGMVLMLLGAIYGFVLKWGPIIWGLIGLIIGGIIGYFIKYFYLKQKNKRKQNTGENIEQSEIIMIINSLPYQEDKVKQILWNNSALGMAFYDK
jgi:hypothetical protein